MIRVVVGDPAAQLADAIARPATTRLDPLTPALERLDAAAGPKFVEQRRARRELPAGASVVTGAGDLPFEFAVHLILGEAADAVTTDTLRRALDAALFQCAQWRIETLALPLPVAGNLAPEGVVAVMLEALREHMRNARHPANVLVITATDAERDLVTARIGQGGL